MEIYLRLHGNGICHPPDIWEFIPTVDTSLDLVLTVWNTKQFSSSHTMILFSGNPHRKLDYATGTEVRYLAVHESKYDQVSLLKPSLCILNLLRIIPGIRGLKVLYLTTKR
jgi:hypothetical protein